MHTLILASLLGLGSSSAMASDGISVSIRVIDVDGNPIASAVVRHPEEKERHRVNMETGTWEAEAVYLEDGTELLFAKKMELMFEVSAPGYLNQDFHYIVKKRKNIALVTLEKMAIDLETDEVDEVGPVIGFKHDVPRD